MTTDRPSDDSPPSDEPLYAIGELAELGGVSRRTVRYYVQRGLLQTPTGLGRGRHYTQEHLDTLVRIRRMQEEGTPLAEIATRLGRSESEPRETGGPVRRLLGSRQQRRHNVTSEAQAATRSEPPSAASTSRWTRLAIADGVELHLRDLCLDPEQARALGEAVTRILQPGGRR